MKNYFVKTPWWLKRIYAGYTWSLPARGKQLYFTFDDGPHPVATPFVLDELKKYQAKATFFCIGKNVEQHPAIYRRILDEGHAVGNHTQNHLNGWKTKDDLYLADVGKAAKHIDSFLFRPPYGRITSFQAKMIKKMEMLQPALTADGVARQQPVSIIMWDVLSGDFDNGLLPEDCLKNVIGHSVSGSIVVFHDSEKAFKRLEYALPRALRYFDEQGFTFEAIRAINN